MEKSDYQTFGSDWVNHVSKMPKQEIVRLATQIGFDKEKLMKENLNLIGTAMDLLTKLDGMGIKGRRIEALRAAVAEATIAP